MMTLLDHGVQAEYRLRRAALLVQQLRLVDKVKADHCLFSTQEIMKLANGIVMELKLIPD